MSAAKKATPRRDLYAEVTASIVDAMETATGWERPWTSLGTGAAFPRNVDGRHYRGVNTLLLWAAAFEHGWSSGTWGTFRAWYADRPSTAEEIADGTAKLVDGEYRTPTRHVRKGEKGTLVVLWKPARRNAKADETPSDDGKVGYLLLRHFWVFAAEQVEGYEPPPVEDVPEFERDAVADGFFERIGADVRYGFGDRAGYLPSADRIEMPAPEAFVDREHFYSTLAHEHGHWTGHRERLDRDLSGRFGDASYAAEELVAELTAAFVGARLGFHATLRDDHAAYMASWIELLRSDDRAIFTAASKAQAACDYLVVAGVDPAAVEIDPAIVGNPTEEVSV